MTIYHLRTNTRIHESFDSLAAAKKRLMEYASERNGRFGVRLLEMEDDGMGFKFLLGWEEIPVRFFIQEVQVTTS